MNEQHETFEETWHRVEVALGGRFRDGIECPGSIVDLYRLALADAGGPCELEGGERLALKEHLHVCPVCRHTYLGALSGARSELQISDEDSARGAIQEDFSQSFGDTAGANGSVLDEFASVETDVQPAEESNALVQVWRMAAEEEPQEIGPVVVDERGRLKTLERTLVLLKPDCVQRRLMGAIISRFEDKGLNIVAMKMLRVTPESSKQHYAEHVEKPFYPGLEAFIIGAPVVAMIVEGLEAIRVVRDMLGATSGLKAAAGTIRGDLSSSRQMNLVHASDGADAAAREIELYFSADEICQYEPTLTAWHRASDE